MRILVVNLLLVQTAAVIPSIEECPHSCLQTLISTIPTPTLFIYDDKNLKLFQHNLTGTILKLGHHLHGSLGQHGVYLIATDDLEGLDWTLGKVYKESTFNSSAIVVAEYFGDDLQGMFELLWKYYLVNALVNVEGLGVYRYYPISLGCCKHLNITYLGACTSNISRWKSKASTFPGCKLRAHVFVSPPFVNPGKMEQNSGLEMMLMEVLMERLKFEVLFVNHTNSYWGSKNNGTYTLSISELHDRKIDMIYGSCSLAYNLLDDFAVVLTQCTLNMHFFVPLARQVEAWMNTLLIFELEAWLAIFASLLATSWVWSLNGGHVLAILEMLVSVTYQRPQRLHLRAIFMTWAVAALVLSSSYQSLMLAFLYKPKYAQQISTVREMIDSKMKFGGIPLAKTLFKSSSLVENWHSCPINPFNCYQRMAIQQDFSLFKNIRYINIQNSINKTKHFKKLNEGFMLILTIYMSKGIPMQTRMEQLILRMRDVGLISKWDVYIKSIKYAVYEPRAKELSLPQLAVAFLVYGCGALVASAVFVWEFFKLGQLYLFK